MIFVEHPKDLISIEKADKKNTQEVKEETEVKTAPSSVSNASTHRNKGPKASSKGDKSYITKTTESINAKIRFALIITVLLCLFFLLCFALFGENNLLKFILLIMSGVALLSISNVCLGCQIARRFLLNWPAVLKTVDKFHFA